ncbi:MAG: N-acetylmuramoyl-L-alanine amidase [Terrimicrobiaceae bacterium]
MPYGTKFSGRRLGYYGTSGLGYCLGQPPPAPDPLPVNVPNVAFVEAHRARWCEPGQANSATCQGLVAPRPIRRIVIHTATSGSAPVPGNQCGNIVPLARIIAAVQNPPANPQNPTSAHYYVDRDGSITQMVREANVAFHVGAHNPDSVGIEHADVCNRPDPYTTQLYERSAALVRDIAARNGIRLSVFGIDTVDRNAATVIGHESIGTHGDPGPYWDWEYYARLLRWDGRTQAARPGRVVAMISPATAVPAGWQARNRVQVIGGTGVQGCGNNTPGCATCIPNSHCANRNHSYSDRYWRAAANTPGSGMVFNFSINWAGVWKISLWWPNVQGANPATFVRAEILHAGGPVGENAPFDQTCGNGRWNDFGGFTFTVPAGGVRGRVSIGRVSSRPGLILADAVRILKVG